MGVSAHTPPENRRETPARWWLLGAAGAAVVCLGLCALAVLLSGGTYWLVAQEKIPNPFASQTPTPTLTSTQTPRPTRTLTPTRTRKPSLTPSLAFTPAATRTPTLTATLAANALPPEGPWLVFDSQDGLWTVNPQGRGLKRLWAERPLLPEGLQANAAPQGGLLAFLAYRELRSGEEVPALHVIRLPEGRVERWLLAVRPSASADEASLRALVSRNGLAWSPDGRKLVFAAVLDGPSVDLYLLDRQDHSLRRLTDLAGDEFAPAWSPDGSTLVYFSSDVDAQGVEWTEVWTVEPIGGRNMRLLERASSRPALAGWSGLHQFLLYRRSEICGGFDLRLGDTLRPYSDPLVKGCFGGATVDGESSNIVFSVSQAQAAYCPCADEPEPAGVYFLPGGQGLPQQLSGREALDVRWLPDARLFFTASAQGWSRAYSSAGAPVGIPADVLGTLPSVGAASGLWAWYSPRNAAPPRGLWLGSNRQQARMIYAGAADFPRWGPAGNTLLFFDGTALMAAEGPDFAPLRRQTMPSAPVDAVWVWR